MVQILTLIKNKKLSWFDKIGFLAMLIYLGYCAFYSIERVCFADTANMFFKIVRDSDFNIEAGRYPQLITQLLLVPARYFELPLNALMFIYSVSFPLFYCLCAFVSTFVYGFNKASWVLVFALTGGLGLTFFHAGTETHQSIAWALIFYGWMNSEIHNEVNQRFQFKRVFVGFLLVILTILSHPVGIFLVIFSILFHCIKNHRMNWIGIFLTLISILFYCVIKFLMTDLNSYEGQFISQLIEFPQLICHLESNYTFNYFTQRLSSTFHIYLIVFIAGILMMIYKRLYLMLLFYLVYPIVFLLFTVLVYHLGDSELMMQRAFLPLGFFLIVPIAELIKFHENLLVKSTQLLFIVSIYFACFYMVNAQGKLMQNRLKYMSALHDTFKASRIYLNTSDVDMQMIGIQWSFCLESLLYSSVASKNNKSYMIAVYNNDELKRKEIFSDSVLISHESFGRISIRKLNPLYFNIDNSIYRSAKFSFPP